MDMQRDSLSCCQLEAADIQTHQLAATGLLVLAQQAGGSWHAGARVPGRRPEGLQGMQQEAGLLPHGSSTGQGCWAGPAAAAVRAVYLVTVSSSCVP